MDKGGEMMLVKRKQEHQYNITVHQETVIDGVKGWLSKLQDRTVFYPSTHWEPVEEWVDIQVNKEDWDCINHSKHWSGQDMTYGIRWRYPQ